MAEINENLEMESMDLKKILIDILESGIKKNNILKDNNFEEEFHEKKTIEDKKKKFKEVIEEKNVEELDVVIRVLQTIYIEKRELKQSIKKLITDSTFRNRIQKLKKDDFSKIYSLIEFINNKFPVDDYPVYTFKPEVVLYGSEVNKTSKSSTHLPPLGNDEIMSCLEVFAERNPEVLYNWVMAILTFDSHKLLDAFGEKYLKERVKLIESVIEKLKTDKIFQKIISEKLFEKNELSRIINIQNSEKEAKEQAKKLEKRIEEMELKAEEKEDLHKKNIQRQQEVIDEKEHELEELRNKVKNYDALSCKLSEYANRHETQVKMNEFLMDKFNREKDIFNHNEKVLQVDVENLQSEMTLLRSKYENVKSDLSLRNSEIVRMKEDSSNKEKKAKENVLSEVVSAIQDQLYYISMYYDELDKDGFLKKESIDMFKTTIQKLNNALGRIGIETYGTLHEIVEYDSALHDSIGNKLCNGEYVEICKPGWKINGVVYSKAQVIKGEK